MKVKRSSRSHTRSRTRSRVPAPAAWDSVAGALREALATETQGRVRNYRLSLAQRVELLTRLRSLGVKRLRSARQHPLSKFQHPPVPEPHKQEHIETLERPWDRGVFLLRVRVPLPTPTQSSSSVTLALGWWRSQWMGSVWVQDPALGKPCLCLELIQTSPATYETLLGVVIREDDFELMAVRRSTQVSGSVVHRLFRDLSPLYDDLPGLVYDDARLNFTPVIRASLRLHAIDRGPDYNWYGSWGFVDIVPLEKHPIRVWHYETLILSQSSARWREAVLRVQNTPLQLFEEAEQKHGTAEIQRGFRALRVRLLKKGKHQATMRDVYQDLMQRLDQASRVSKHAERDYTLYCWLFDPEALEQPLAFQESNGWREYYEAIEVLQFTQLRRRWAFGKQGVRRPCLGRSFSEVQAFWTTLAAQPEPELLVMQRPRQAKRPRECRITDFFRPHRLHHSQGEPS